MPPLEHLCQPGLRIAMADERSVCHWQSNNPPGLGGCGASLKLSMGTLTVHGTRESIPLDAKEGDWLLDRALRSHSDEDGTLRVLSAHISMPTTTTAWLPTALYRREAHMRGLRRCSRSSLSCSSSSHFVSATHRCSGRSSGESRRRTTMGIPAVSSTRAYAPRNSHTRSACCHHDRQLGKDTSTCRRL
jgi:hypothetical protein